MTEIVIEAGATRLALAPGEDGRLHQLAFGPTPTDAADAGPALPPGDTPVSTVLDITANWVG